MSDKETITLRDGFATKCGGMVKSWKRRWFVLKSNGFLYYYETANCKNEKGKIDVISADEVSLVKEGAAASTLPSNFSHSNSFAVVSGGRTYICVCDSNEDARGWIEAFNQVRLPSNDYPPPTYAKTEQVPTPLPTKVPPQQYSASQPTAGFAPMPQPVQPHLYAPQANHPSMHHPSVQPGPPIPRTYTCPPMQQPYVQAGPPRPPPYMQPAPPMQHPYGPPMQNPYGPPMPHPQYPPQQQQGYYRPPYYPQGPPPRPAQCPPPGPQYYQPRPIQQSSVNVTVINI